MTVRSIHVDRFLRERERKNRKIFQNLIPSEDAAKVKPKKSPNTF